MLPKQPRLMHSIRRQKIGLGRAEDGGASWGLRMLLTWVVVTRVHLSGDGSPNCTCKTCTNFNTSMLYFNKIHIYFKTSNEDKMNNPFALSIQLEQSRQPSSGAVQHRPP